MSKLRFANNNERRLLNQFLVVIVRLTVPQFTLGGLESPCYNFHTMDYVNPCEISPKKSTNRGLLLSSPPQRRFEIPYTIIHVWYNLSGISSFIDGENIVSSTTPIITEGRRRSESLLWHYFNPDDCGMHFMTQNYFAFDFRLLPFPSSSSSLQDPGQHVTCLIYCNHILWHSFILDQNLWRPGRGAISTSVAYFNVSEITFVTFLRVRAFP